MAYLEKFRRCNKCDDRDAITYDQGASPTSQLCDAGDPLPCAYVAQFGCRIDVDGICVAGASGGVAGAIAGDAWEDGDVTLRVPCEFEAPCVFKSVQNNIGLGVTCVPLESCHQDFCCTALQDVVHNGQPCVGCTNPGACQWVHRLGMLDGVTWGWELDPTADPVQLVHAAAGVTYEATATWARGGANTMALIDPLIGTTLPAFVCVIPKPYERPATWDCSPAALVEQNCCDDAVPCGYSDSDRAVCCDPCCDCIPDQPLWCGGDSTTVTPCVGGGNGLAGVDAPSGQTYGACATLGGREICANWYCSSGQWKLDGYIDAVFCGTGDLTHTCCPLTLGTTTLTGCPECDICVGEDCEPPPIDQCCCPDDPVPATLYLTGSMTSGCACAGALTATLTHNGSAWVGTAATGGCLGDVEIELTCVGGTCLWVLGLDYTACGGTADSLQAVTVSCNPFILTFGGDEDAGADPCCDTTPYTLSITVQD